MSAGTAPGRNVSSEIAYLARALKAPSLAGAVDRLAERARADGEPGLVPDLDGALVDCRLRAVWLAWTSRSVQPVPHRWGSECFGL